MKDGGGVIVVQFGNPENKQDKTLLTYAAQLDAADDLRGLQDEFYKQAGIIYMDGNSLGLLSRAAEASLLTALNDWKLHAIGGWTQANPPWFELAERLAANLAPLVGAKSEEVMVTSSTTTNLHQLTSTFYEPRRGRTKILADTLTFPSDLYALQSQLQLHGLDADANLVLVPSRDGRMLLEEDLEDAMSDDIALAVLPTVLYRSGQLLDTARLTKRARDKGICIGWDACHSAGVVPHHFHDEDADFAFWCTYKYLNAGPGAAAALFVHERNFGRSPGLAGWFSSNKEKQFDMETVLSQASHAGAYQIGTPHILSMAPLIGSLEIYEHTSVQQLRNKSLALTEYLLMLADECLAEFGFVMGTPRESNRRGGHVSLEHVEAIRICEVLKAEGVIPDYRAPNVIRLAPVPLYTSFSEVWKTVHILQRIMTDKLYEQFDSKRGVVA